MNVHETRAVNLAAAVAGNAEELIKGTSGNARHIAQTSTVGDCLKNGYAPRGYQVADFTLVRHRDVFHLFHIPRVPGNSCLQLGHEHWFGHAVSRDLDTWTTGDPALCVEPMNEWESGHVWAPFVLEAGGCFHMFYTGLSDEPSQVLCHAVAEDDELRRWKRLESNPITPFSGFDWHFQNEFGHCRHARDPHVVRVGDHWLMAYTTMHRNGCPAVGGLVSRDLTSWEDIGPIHYRPMGRAKWLPESVNIQPMPDGRWVMIPSQSPGLEYIFSDDPHAWHGAQAKSIRFLDDSGDAPFAPEVIARRSDAWLVAYFVEPGNRMYVGEIDITADPWTLTPVREAAGLGGWNENLGLG